LGSAERGAPTVGFWGSDGGSVHGAAQRAQGLGVGVHTIVTLIKHRALAQDLRPSVIIIASCG
jgi:hypothetical protein